jgi:hypothetical protein
MRSKRQAMATRNGFAWFRRFCVNSRVSPASSSSSNKQQVELTRGSVLLERVRRAFAEIDAAINEARRVAPADGGILTVGYGPLSHTTRRGSPTRSRRLDPTCRSGSKRTRRPSW